jgi:putative endonuclease
MWFVYILLCSDQSFYTGATNDLQKRFATHQAGKGGNYTRSHPPIKIVYSEKFATKSEALKREIEIKSWSKAKKIRKFNLAFNTAES